VKPPMGYFGSKVNTADRIVSLLPEHEHYVEPFAGSLAVLLAKPPSLMETVNDLDARLVTFWRVLREQPAEFERVCGLTPHSLEEYLTVKARAKEGFTGGEVERARQLWVLLTQGRGGHLTRGAGWRYHANARGRDAGMPEQIAAYVQRIAPAAARLRKVSLECRPALSVIAAYGNHPGTLIYADPPYLGSTRTKAHGRTRGPDYVHDMRSPEAHSELAAALHAADAAVVISGYPSPLYDDLYEGWHRAEFTARAGNGGTKQARTEVVWCNRPAAQPTLFDHHEEETHA
jgi:DNA adenine methylase